MSTDMLPDSFREFMAWNPYGPGPKPLPLAHVVEAPLPTRHHGVTPEQVRQFRPDVCCDHVWVPHGIYGEDGVYREDGHERCLRCGATCTRAKDGTIEEYEAYAPC